VPIIYLILQYLTSFKRKKDCKETLQLARNFTLLGFTAAEISSGMVKFAQRGAPEFLYEQGTLTQ
jgi:hypothetical protein